MNTSVKVNSSSNSVDKTNTEQKIFKFHPKCIIPYNKCNKIKSTDFSSAKIKHHDMLNKKPIKKREKKLSRSTHDLQDTKKINENLLDGKSIIIHNVKTGEYTTNIQNNLNININTQSNGNIETGIGTSQLNTNLISFSSSPVISPANVNTKHNTYTSKDSHLNTSGNVGKFFDNKSYIKLKEELLDLKIKNEKLHSEVNLLNEKLKKFKSLFSYNEKKTEMIKKNYQDIIENIKKNNEKLIKGSRKNSIADTKTKIQIENLNIINNEKNKKVEVYLSSTLSILLEVIELFLQKQPRDSVLRTNNENISYSIDIYDSYVNDDEKRGTLIDQIQSIIMSKLKFLKIATGLNLEKEISKVKGWNNLIPNRENNNSNVNFSLSNISGVKFSLRNNQNNTKERDLSNTSCI